MGTVPARCSPRRAVASGAVVLALVAGGCSDDGDSGCGPITREALDPAYVVHVLGNDTDVEYTSDPPTSGPHQLAPPVDGVVGEPLARPVQVGVLERGDILIQHDPDLEASQVDELEAIAGDGVVVAPGSDLPSPIVATAWLYKRTCDTVDAGALEDFIEERRGKGPDQ